MNAITVPSRIRSRTRRHDRRLQVRVPHVERRQSAAEQCASAALAAQFREVREHSYLAGPTGRFRVC